MPRILRSRAREKQVAHPHRWRETPWFSHPAAGFAPVGPAGVTCACHASTGADGDPAVTADNALVADLAELAEREQTPDGGHEKTSGTQAQ